MKIDKNTQDVCSMCVTTFIYKPFHRVNTLNFKESHGYFFLCIVQNALLWRQPIRCLLCNRVLEFEFRLQNYVKRKMIKLFLRQTTGIESKSNRSFGYSLEMESSMIKRILTALTLSAMHSSSLEIFQLQGDMYIRENT